LGSATLLELANVLSNDEPLIHELMLLWNNGEEVALLGSKAFANWDPAFGKYVNCLFIETRGFEILTSLDSVFKRARILEYG
jgi:Zn-dependent M28 family amino/carboxypeptidase